MKVELTRILKLELKYPEIPEDADSSYMYDLIKDVTSAAENAGFTVLSTDNKSFISSNNVKYTISTA